MRRSLLAVVCPLFLTLAACLQDHKEVKVKPDGSGTLTVTTLMSNEALAQLRQMAQAFGGGQGGAKMEDPFSEEKAKKDAANYGPGVEFVSAEKITQDGMEGLKAVYTFKDITTLVLDQKPSNPGPKMPGQPADEKDPLVFKREKLANGNTLITIVQPMKEPEETPQPETPVPQEIPDAQFQMMKQMFKGLRFSVSLIVDGTLVKTNTPHIKENTITVMAVDFDKLLENPEKFKELAKKQPKTVEDMKKVMKDVPGITFNPEPTTTVEFK